MKAISIQKYFVLAVFTAFFAEYSYSQQCNPSSNPFNESERCREIVNGALDTTFSSRIIAIGPTAGHKKKTRSLFVNQSINRVGGFGVTMLKPNGGNERPRHANPNAVGSTFAVDIDGDCVYEREDELLSWIQQNHFNEIVLYNVDALLQFGKRNLVSFNRDVQDPKQVYDNLMGETKNIEWHLARFIHKAKTEYDLDVVAIVPKGIETTVYDTNFYEFHLNYSRNSYEYYLELLGDYTTDFIDKYIDKYHNTPWEINYLEYGEDTLFLPMDDDGRISDIDKLIVDVYNLHVFQLRTQLGFVHHGGVDGTDDDPDACNSLPSENSCLKGFDAHMIEWEWWDNIPSEVDGQFGLMQILVAFAKELEIKYSTICKLKYYLCQHKFDDSDWTSSVYTAQQRADIVDSIADRIYLYSYHNNPCDCYNGKTNSHDVKFETKVQLLANNGFGANNGQSVIVPVFNAKFYDEGLQSSPLPEVYGDGNMGCGGILTAACDYCADYSGNALRSLHPSYPSFLGFVENVFQDQYDLDSVKTANSDNIIYGYSWFKSSLLINHNFLSSTKTLTPPKDKQVILYPNPSNNGNFELKSESEIKEIHVYTLNGALILHKVIMANQANFQLNIAGIHFVQISYKNGDKEVVKAVKL